MILKRPLGLLVCLKFIIQSSVASPRRGLWRVHPAFVRVVPETDANPASFASPMIMALPAWGLRFSRPLLRVRAGHVWRWSKHFVPGDVPARVSRIRCRFHDFSPQCTGHFCASLLIADTRPMSTDRKSCLRARSEWAHMFWSARCPSPVFWYLRCSCLNGTGRHPHALPCSCNGSARQTLPKYLSRLSRL